MIQFFLVLFLTFLERSDSSLHLIEVLVPLEHLEWRRQQPREYMCLQCLQTVNVSCDIIGHTSTRQHLYIKETHEDTAASVKLYCAMMAY